MGMVKVTCVPFSNSLTTFTFPPRSVKIPRTIDNPRPKPPDFCDLAKSAR